jgi:hypothetical protein
MQPYSQDVVAGHRLMLDTLRQSEKCEHGVLYVYQSLFAAQTTVLNGFYRLDKDGKDQVVQLSGANYAPQGQTALYDAILTMANELDVHLKEVVRRGYLPAARVAVITDGGENASAARREQVVEAIRHLRDKEWLESSIVIGLKNPDFDESKLEALRDSIGFSQKIGLDRNSREIRRAFVLASKFKPDKN